MFEKILAKIAKVLNEKKIPYMVIGGQALLQWGEPRLTEDIDITLGFTSDRCPEVTTLLQKIDIKPLKEATGDFIRKTSVLPCQELTEGIRIDFIFSFLPYEEEAIRRAKGILIENQKVKFASAEDLIIHKMFAGRSRDIDDVKNILIKQKENLDYSYIHKNLQEFSSLEGYKNILKHFQDLEKDI
ncbi:MAG: nucleotidyltransferase [Chlamydiae bacterium]|nr:nucleotidyltransferase [Chlamydiota bacterium]MBI3265986.1 nucleotidyltransferase [Chlamydiota bacterium]